MVSVKTIEFCNGDITKIKNYEKAIMDNTVVWKVFHKNLLTGVGRIKKSTLKALGKYCGVEPEELEFMRKDQICKIERKHKMSKKNAHTIHTVFTFWTKLHPHKLFSEITDEEFEEIQRSVRRLRILWNQMKARCHNKNAQDYPNYGALGVRVCREWFNDSDKFVLWALKSGYRYNPTAMRGDQLSIDRIDPSKNYSPSNCRWIKHRENCARTRRADWDFIINRCYEIARRFPKAADVCWGRARIIWKDLRDIYMGGDTSRLVQFMKECGYTPMGIWRVRKELGDVIPQKKSERN